MSDEERARKERLNKMYEDDLNAMRNWAQSEDNPATRAMQSNISNEVSYNNNQSVRNTQPVQPTVDPLAEFFGTQPAAGPAQPSSSEILKPTSVLDTISQIKNYQNNKNKVLAIENAKPTEFVAEFPEISMPERPKTNRTTSADQEVTQINAQSGSVSSGSFRPRPTSASFVSDMNNVGQESAINAAVNKAVTPNPTTQATLQPQKAQPDVAPPKVEPKNLQQHLLDVYKSETDKLTRQYTETLKLAPEKKAQFDQVFQQQMSKLQHQFQEAFTQAMQQEAAKQAALQPMQPAPVTAKQPKEVVEASQEVVKSEQVQPEKVASPPPYAELDPAKPKSVTKLETPTQNALVAELKQNLQQPNEPAQPAVTPQAVTQTPPNLQPVLPQTVPQPQPLTQPPAQPPTQISPLTLMPAASTLPPLQPTSSSIPMLPTSQASTSATQNTETQPKFKTIEQKQQETQAAIERLAAMNFKTKEQKEQEQKLKDLENEHKKQTLAAVQSKYDEWKKQQQNSQNEQILAQRRALGATYNRYGINTSASNPYLQQHMQFQQAQMQQTYHNQLKLQQQNSNIALVNQMNQQKQQAAQAQYQAQIIAQQQQMKLLEQQAKTEAAMKEQQKQQQIAMMQAKILDQKKQAEILAAENRKREEMLKQQQQAAQHMAAAQAQQQRMQQAAQNANLAAAKLVQGVQLLQPIPGMQSTPIQPTSVQSSQPMQATSRIMQPNSSILQPSSSTNINTSGQVPVNRNLTQNQADKLAAIAAKYKINM